MKKTASCLILIFAVLSLVGCSTFQVVSLATMAFTGKGFGDHALSVATGRDCAFFNIVQDEKICVYDNFADMMLLTNGQNIDESFKMLQPVDNYSNAYLVIGSFSRSENAQSYQTEYRQLNSIVIAPDIASGKNYRVVVGPVYRQELDNMKKTLMNEGIHSSWLIVL